MSDKLNKNSVENQIAKIHENNIEAAKIAMIKPLASTRLFQTKHPLRMVTATTLFDGHDVTINMLRHFLQSSGVEVIHIGHNRSVEEIVKCAIQEDAQAIVITSCQGGHMEFFRHMYDLLQEQKALHIKIFGGGGTILTDERDALHQYGITRIYSPDDGRKSGLAGMIEDLISKCDIPSITLPKNFQAIREIKDMRHLASLTTLAENNPVEFESLRSELAKLSHKKRVPVLGLTGTGGAGKSSLIDELIRLLLIQFEAKRIAVICVDPSRKKTGGALLADRIRINTASHPNVTVRSIASRSADNDLTGIIKRVVEVYKAAAFDLIIIETPGTGQSDMSVIDYSDISMFVMTSEFGAPSQLEKINMLDYADIIVLNKFSKDNSLEALDQVKRQYTNKQPAGSEEVCDLPVIATNASHFNDAGVKRLFRLLIEKIRSKTNCFIEEGNALPEGQGPEPEIIPPHRAGYLEEIVETLKTYNNIVKEQSLAARQLFQLTGTKTILEQQPADDASKALLSWIETTEKNIHRQLNPGTKEIIANWKKHTGTYSGDSVKFFLNGKEHTEELFVETISLLKMPKVGLPKFEDWGEIVRWSMQENLPGFFPFTAGVFPFRRDEEITRLTAGEGSAERSNRRFHYLTKDMKAKRLSTAHDAVTLYGFDPDYRPDIYGKIGGTGVSISHVDDAKILYSGFNLADPSTSVNLTINGPSAIILAFFLHAAIDQQCELYIHQHGLTEIVKQKISEKFAAKNLPIPVFKDSMAKQKEDLGLFLLGVTGEDVLPKNIYEQIKSDTLKKVRGTVQSDILKEDQAQNTCIFSTSFSLKMMADIQEYFIARQVKHFYSVSVSGYHIAEAGANPITQIAFTLANGFTYIEYYLSRGMKIDEFVPNFSFFFSTGPDPEYAVLGRVCRRIWAKVLKYKYHANDRSQKLKYHIQTSGRSLQLQEIDFNDIRTTLQALNAIYDNCNSLHTNANDEALSLPTEKSVRKALAIQKIINKEMGLAKNQNPLQGSFIIEELTDLVEEAVIQELHQLARHGGVLSAMESTYQRSKIQNESLYYETLKHNGSLPIIGVNTFKNETGSPTETTSDVVRIDRQECNAIIEANRSVMERNKQESTIALTRLQKAVYSNQNIFECLMEVSKYCTLGQLSAALINSGGEYRRNL
jgi:isobutyryl-CoA mutase